MQLPRNVNRCCLKARSVVLFPPMHCQLLPINWKRQSPPPAQRFRDERMQMQRNTMHHGCDVTHLRRICLYRSNAELKIKIIPDTRIITDVLFVVQLKITLAFSVYKWLLFHHDIKKTCCTLFCRFCQSYCRKCKFLAEKKTLGSRFFSPVFSAICWFMYLISQYFLLQNINVFPNIF